MPGDKWIVLNVGGTIFETSRTTLIRSTPPSSPLHKISSNSTNTQWDRDQRGAYLIDRDPVYFAPVLNYLRHGRLVLNKDVSEEGVLIEAEYFNLPELVKAVRNRINETQLKLKVNNQQPQLSNGQYSHYDPFRSPTFCGQHQQETYYAHFVNQVLKQDI